MSVLSEQEAVFKVNQAIGSMAIEGIVLTAKQQQAMLRIVQGQVSAASLRAKWLAKYSQLKS
ncbi:hypothetical protein AKN87_05070 [Thiopseudomonas alkaliphila]|uniref:Antitoxin VbhA domain-containing protein n=1 Tax=Thiopseudomonas alkaliphila TaxID=1697053 RepID=A0A0K1XCW4_9GAMM|nr:antitoxin VbhA family protein [Thiopseudomonas alkaliphila]AKX44543.1 hypothetical protein AKN87_05070 [Thiopseudomonas alkaliphila]AKX59033.1 hypothetical protein AKN88_03065 [Thiopseudomonas alkaliphila]